MGFVDFYKQDLMRNSHRILHAMSAAPVVAPMRWPSGTSTQLARTHNTHCVSILGLCGVQNAGKRTHLDVIR